MQTPTDELYGQLQAAYRYLNHHLFDDQLPGCVFTLQRHHRVAGYYAKSRFLHRGTNNRADEIALNPEYFALSPIEAVLSTLAHEMAHQWQDHFGTPSRGNYHNQEWANKMISIGLMPSDTGQPGGRTVGQRMSDYIIEDGPFRSLCNALIAEHGETTPWVDVFARKSGVSTSAPVSDGTHRLEESNPELSSLIDAGLQIISPNKPGNKQQKNKIKYTCPACQTNVWGKPELSIGCMPCQEEMKAQTGDN